MPLSLSHYGAAQSFWNSSDVTAVGRIPGSSPFPLENVDEVSPPAVLIDPMGKSTAGARGNEHMA